MNMRTACVAAMCGLTMGLSSAALADVFTWQGRLLDGGAPANGVFDFEFELYDDEVGGSLINGLTLTVDDVVIAEGLVTVDLDFGAGAFPNEKRWLQINVKADAAGGYTALSPRQPVQPTPYAHFAFEAAGVADGGLPGVYNDPITFSNPGNQFAGNGSGLTKLNADELITGNVNAARMPTGGNWSLSGALNVDGGGWYFDPTTNRMGVNTSGPSDTLTVAGTGRITGDVMFGSGGGPNIQFDVSNAQIDTFNGGVNKARLWGATWGELLLWDSDGDQTVFLSSDGIFGLGAGQLQLRNEDGSIAGFQALGGFNNGGQLTLRSSENFDTIVMNGEGISGGVINMFNDAGMQTVFVDSDSGGGGYLQLENSSSSLRAVVDGHPDGRVALYQADGSIGVLADGDGGTNAGGRFHLYDNTGLETVRLTGQGASGGGGISLFNSLGTQTIELDPDEADDSTVRLFNSNGTATIVLRSDFNGVGRIITDELELTGADLSERFSIAAPEGVDIEPGMVVCIDPANPGKLIVSTQPYDFTVAGIVSGAGGVRPGMLMGQPGTLADGDLPVALTGRVYVWCDASNGAIQPGHLLTTSPIPGHAMRATDRERSHGAIIGKAMTSLEEGEGTGLVLVLVGLH